MSNCRLFKTCSVLPSRVTLKTVDIVLILDLPALILNVGQAPCDLLVLVATLSVVLSSFILLHFPFLSLYCHLV